MEHNGTQLLQKSEKRKKKREREIWKERTQFWNNDEDGKTRNSSKCLEQ